MLFRVVMVTTLLLIAVYVEAVSETLLPRQPALLPHRGDLRASPSSTPLALRFLPDRERAQVYAQVVGDLLVITGLVYLTGGIRAGFMLLYPISVLSGSVLLVPAAAAWCWPASRPCSTAALLLGGARRASCRPQGLADVPVPPGAARSSTRSS